MEANKRVSVHLVWSKSLFNEKCFVPSKYKVHQQECEGFDVKEILPKWSTPIMLYPINFLRNIARKGAQTTLHIVADIENIFSQNFTAMVKNETQKLLQSKEKYVLVYRRFETSSKSPPQNVMELQKLLRTRRANIFHSHIFPRGHSIPELKNWIQYSVATNIVTSWPLQYKHKSWEPQFIMKSGAPYHFEMPTRVYDHQVLVQELCRAGYTFRLLTHVFNTHLGMKTEMSDLEKAIKRSSKLKAAEAEERFNLYLNTTYGNDSIDKCPKTY